MSGPHNGFRWFVLRTREDNPPEVYPFDDELLARAFYDRASAQWTETYLVCNVSILTRLRMRLGQFVQVWERLTGLVADIKEEDRAAMAAEMEFLTIPPNKRHLPQQPPSQGRSNG